MPPHSTPIVQYRLKTPAELADVPYWETDTNPLRVLRDTSKITQKDLARLASVSEQMITRHESGLINQTSVKVIRALSELTGVSEERIDIEYTKWVYKRRAALSAERLQVRTDTPDHLIMDLCHYVGVPGTVYSLCRILACHPFTAQVWVSSGRLNFTMRAALEEGGLI